MWESHQPSGLLKAGPAPSHWARPLTLPLPPTPAGYVPARLHTPAVPRGITAATLAPTAAASLSPALDRALALIPSVLLHCATLDRPHHLSGLCGPCLEGRANGPGSLGASEETQPHRMPCIPEGGHCWHQGYPTAFPHACQEGNDNSRSPSPRDFMV